MQADIPNGRVEGRASEPTLDLWSEAQAPVDVCADAVHAQAELWVAVVLVSPAGSVAHVQLVTAPGHGRDSLVELLEVGKAGDVHA